MASTGLQLFTVTTRSASHRLLPTVFRLPLLTSGVIEFIRFDRALHLTLHLIGQGTIAQPPAPAIAGPDMDPTSLAMRHDEQVRHNRKVARIQYASGLLLRCNRVSVRSLKVRLQLWHQ